MKFTALTLFLTCHYNFTIDIEKCHPKKKKKKYFLIKLTGQEIKYNYFFLKFLFVLSQFVTLPTKLGTSCLKLYSSLISILVSTLSGMVLPQTLMACLEGGGRKGSGEE